MSWQPELDELRRREALAREMGGAERVARQRAQGKLTARERVDRLLDDGSFHETGALAGVGAYDDDGELTGFTPANMVVGQGRVEGRRVVLQADDFTVRGGAADDAAIWQKMVWAEQAAHELRQPLVRLVDGTGGGGSVKSLETMGFSYVPPLPGFEYVVENLSRVPVVAAALGPCAGLGAARVALSHFSVIVRGTAQLFVAGPPVVAAAMGESPDKEQLGGARAQTRAGAVDNEAADEDDALAQLRRYLSYLPGSAWEAPPVVAGSDDPARREEELLSIVRASRARATGCGASSSWSSTAARCSRSGRATGDRSSPRWRASTAPRRDPRLRSPPLRRRRHRRGLRQARALRRHLRCVPPARRELRRRAGLRDRHRRRARGHDAPRRAGPGRRAPGAHPVASVLVRKVFGVAGAGHGDGSRLNLRFAWPSGDWGSLPIERRHRGRLPARARSGRGSAASARDIEDRLNRVRSPFRTAERFSVEEIIDPRATRPILCDWAQRATSSSPSTPTSGP